MFGLQKARRDAGLFVSCPAKWLFRLDTGMAFGFPLPDFDSQSGRMNVDQLTKAKSLGFSDRQIAHLTGITEDAIRAERK